MLERRRDGSDPARRADRPGTRSAASGSDYRGAGPLLNCPGAAEVLEERCHRGGCDQGCRQRIRASPAAREVSPDYRCPGRGQHDRGRRSQARDRRGLRGAGRRRDARDGRHAACVGGGPPAAAAAVGAEMLERVGMPLVSGMVSQPRLSRGSRDGIVLAVNGRPISSRALVYALEECYQGRLERGRHPVAVIDIGIDPELVDVNVHPAKKEVRFRDEGTVFAALQRAVRAALDGSEPFRYRPVESMPSVGADRVTPQLSIHEVASAFATAEPMTVGSVAPTVLRPIGQAGPGYLVAEGPHGLVLVDQHAAHERVLYNRLLARLRSGRGMSQPLLIPQAVDVEPALIAAAADHRADLANLGLEYEECGPRSLRITAVPVEMPAGRATAAVQETLAALAENRGDGALEKAAAALACHSAVRFGDVLDVP